MQNRRSTNETNTTRIQPSRAITPIAFCPVRDMDPAKMHLPITKPIISADDRSTHPEASASLFLAGPIYPPN